MRLDAAADHWVILDRTISKPERGDRKTVGAKIVSRPTVMLLVARRLSSTDAAEGQAELLQPRRQAPYAQRERRIAASARRYLDKKNLIDLSAPVVPIFEAPMMRELVFHDAPVGLVSSRIYRVYQPMRKYHDLHMARAQIAALMRDRIYSLEPGNDASWALDAAVWQLARAWQIDKSNRLRDHRADHHRLLRTSGNDDLVWMAASTSVIAQIGRERLAQVRIAAA